MMLHHGDGLRVSTKGKRLRFLFLRVAFVRIHFAIVPVELRLDVAETYVGWNTEKPSAQIAFVDMFDIARHRFDLPQLAFSPHLMNCPC